jgi:hypothetical protein
MDRPKVLVDKAVLEMLTHFFLISAVVSPLPLNMLVAVCELRWPGRQFSPQSERSNGEYTLDQVFDHQSGYHAEALLLHELEAKPEKDRLDVELIKMLRARHKARVDELFAYLGIPLSDEEE